MSVARLGEDFRERPGFLPRYRGCRQRARLRDLDRFGDRASGRRAWSAVIVALKAVPEWRWGPSGERSLWYPSARLMRQSRRGDWNELFVRIAGVVAALRDGQKPLRTAMQGRIASIYRYPVKGFSPDAPFRGRARAEADACCAIGSMRSRTVRRALIRPHRLSAEVEIPLPLEECEARKARDHLDAETHDWHIDGPTSLTARLSTAEGRAAAEAWLTDFMGVERRGRCVCSRRRRCLHRCRQALRFAYQSGNGGALSLE